jgi:hypothetical protein
MIEIPLGQHSSDKYDDSTLSSKNLSSTGLWPLKPTQRQHASAVGPNNNEFILLGSSMSSMKKIHYRIHSSVIFIFAMMVLLGCSVCTQISPLETKMTRMQHNMECLIVNALTLMLIGCGIAAAGAKTASKVLAIQTALTMSPAIVRIPILRRMILPVSR